MEAAEKYYTKLMERGINELGGVKLTASWETVVGSVGEFTHVLEYEGYKGFDETSRALKKDSVCLHKASSMLDPDILGNGQAKFCHLAKHHLSTTSNHLRVLLLAFLASS
jgi:hypothetical protein